MARLNKKLNLVIPVEMDSGATAYVHSMPISREVFELHYLVLAKSFSKVYGEQLGYLVGPRVAMLVLRQTADEMGIRDQVEQSLINEIYRLSNIMHPTEKGGWDTIPLANALSQNLIDADSKLEMDNALAFFTLVSAVRGQKAGMEALSGMCNLWETKITLSGLTEYQGSLPTSIATAISPPMAASSVPS